MNQMVDTFMQRSALSNTTMLVRLKRSMYQPYAFDAVATNDVIVRSGVVDAGRFNKRLFRNCPEVADTNAAFNEAYRYVTAHTVPWMDDGWRWMPATLYTEVTKRVGELINQCRKRVQDLEAKWPQLVAADIARLGSLANPDDYPQDIGSKYAIDIRFSPVPDANDFRVAISDEDRDSLNRAIEDAKANASKYLMAELLDPIKKAAEKLRVPIGQDGSVFRDSLLTNITEVVDRARRLNFTNDPSVASLINEISGGVASYAKAPDLLREDIGARNNATAQLDAIMSKMAGLF